MLKSPVGLREKKSDTCAVDVEVDEGPPLQLGDVHHPQTGHGLAVQDLRQLRERIGYFFFLVLIQSNSEID